MATMPVWVTKGNCADTSVCMLVTSLERFVRKGSDFQVMLNGFWQANHRMEQRQRR